MRYAGRVAALTTIYYASAKLGLLAAVAHSVVSSAWPPAGVALAALLLFGVRLWPGVMAGAFILNATSGVPLAGAAGIAAGDTLEAVVGALVLLRLAKFDASLGRLRDVLSLILVGAFASTALSATIGVASLRLSGSVDSTAPWHLWVVWWAGDAIGILVVTPLILAWARKEPRPGPHRLARALEASALFMALATLTILLFRNPHNYAYAVFPLAGWIAVRFGLRGIATATASVAVIATAWTVVGLGPFAGTTPTERLSLLQVFLGLLAISGLVFAAVLSERRGADEGRRMSELRYRNLAAFAPIGIYRSTREGRLLEANQAFAGLLGFASVEDLMGLDVGKEIYFDGADRERLIGEMDSRGNTADFEVRLKGHDGLPVWVRIDSRALRDAAGALEGFEGFVHDIGPRKAAEEELKRSEQRFSLVFHSTPVATSITDMRTDRFLDVNREFERVLGYSHAEVMKHTSEELGIWVDREERERVHADLLRTGFSDEHEGRVRTKSGEVRSVIASVVRVELGGWPCALSAFSDVTERRLALDDLRKSEERYRLLFDNNPQPMWVFDDETLRFLAVNAAACSHYGYSREEFLGMTILDIRPPVEVDALKEHLYSDRENLKADTWRHRKKDGTVIDVEITAHRLVFDGRPARLVLALDVTERKKLEQQLRQSQKMEAVGRLAGGVAHDFNNVLTAILGYADLLGDEVGAGNESVVEIKQAGERAATLTRQLLAFSRQQVLEPKVLQVNDLVANLEKMLRRLIGEDIQLVARLESGLWNVRADVGQLEQVIVNLAVNARDAMPRGGTLSIETMNVQLDGTPNAGGTSSPAGDYAMVVISDNGTGMDAETKSHIFEPFFTTKGVGKGTGLGLATVYGIVKQSNGFIWAYSEPGLGSAFKIYLPRVRAALDDTLTGRPVARPVGGTETVLLAEDEDAVRGLTRRLLERIGYRVLEACDGKSAIEALAAHPEPIDVLLSDLVMPDVSGTDLAEQVRAARPEVKVVFMSGYTEDAVVRHGLGRDIGHFLQKPFSADALARKLREVIDARRSSSTA